jgi:hypothetical protein
MRNVKHKTCNHKNTRRIEKKCIDIHLCSDFFGYDTKRNSNKNKNRQMASIKLKSFLIVKETINKVKNATDGMEEASLQNI